MPEYHEIREFSEGEPMCPLPWDNRFYLMNNKTWECRQCHIEYEPDPKRRDSWFHYETREVWIPYS